MKILIGAMLFMIFLLLGINIVQHKAIGTWREVVMVKEQSIQDQNIIIRRQSESNQELIQILSITALQQINEDLLFEDYVGTGGN